MPKWPRGKGPIVGQCPYCHGVIRIKWSCKVARETYCTKCGEVDVRKVSTKVLARDPTRDLVDEVWKSLHKKEVHLQPFLKTVQQKSKDTYGVSIGKISRSELEKWGYVVSSDWLRKVR